jgi:hypothetical protein
MGSLAFALQLIREAGPDAIWCPTIPQAEARAAELTEQRRVADVQRALGPHVMTV